MSMVVHEFGSPTGADLVLLHGLPEAGTTWPDAVRRWGSRFRVLAPDLRGHGHSPRFTAPQLGDPMAVLLDDVVGLLEGVCRGPALLLGHSLGGRLALLVGARRPDLVDRLVLEDPALADMDTAPAGFAAQQHEFLDAFADGGVGERARMRAQTSWSAAEILAWAEVKPLADRGVIDHLNLGRLDAAAVLQATTTPTLLVVPADGETARHRALVTNPLVQVAPISDVGHCVRRDDPDAFHGVVDPFLLGEAGVRG